MSAVVPGPGRALDIGAGFGDFLIQLRARGWTVEGTEVSREAIARAARNGIRLHYGQPEEAHLPPGSFDLVTMWHVLEHVPFPGRTLAECARLLKPGGALVVAVPNDSLFPRLAGFLLMGKRQSIQVTWGQRVPGEEIHLSFFSPRRLRQALTRVGLTTVVVDLDDHYAESNTATDAKLRRNRRLWIVTGRRLSIHRTIYALARRDPACTSPALHP